MALPIQDYLIGANDTYAPLFPIPELQQYDNYQIYSIIGIDYPYIQTFLNSAPTAYTYFNPFQIGVAENGYTMQATGFGTILQAGFFTNFIAYQQYSVNEITIDFKLLADKILLIQPKNNRKSIYISSINVISSLSYPSSVTPNLVEINQLRAIAAFNNSIDANQFSYVYVRQGGGVYCELRQWIYTSTGTNPNSINLDSLLDGYGNKLKPLNRKIIPSVDEIITIEYYRINKTESLPVCRSIDWMSYDVQLKKNVPTILPIVDCVFGTLSITGSNVTGILSKLDSTCLPNEYKYSDFLNENIDIIIAKWVQIANQYVETPVHPNRFYEDSKIYNTPVLRLLAANNNFWNNGTEVNNINFDPNHPIFAINNEQAYDWHVRPQTEGIGNLIMDSPRTIETKLMVEQLTKALGGDKFATYIEPTTGEKVDRFSNLGWYIENIARVLGLRVDEKGYINSSKEEDLYTRQILNDPQYDKNAYSKNSFGRYGRLTPHLTNSNGLKAFDKVADIPQLLEALFEHLNRSIGIQQGTEIEVLNSTTGKKDYYPNQFAMLLDIHSKITEIQLNAKENHNLLQVIAHEVRELFSGIGIPISFKTLWGRYGEMLYVGHQKDRGSLLESLTTLKMNIGILVGNLLVDRPRDSRNPLERIFDKPKKKG